MCGREGVIRQKCFNTGAGGGLLEKKGSRKGKKGGGTQRWKGGAKMSFGPVERKKTDAALDVGRKQTDL